MLAFTSCRAAVCSPVLVPVACPCFLYNEDTRAGHKTTHDLFSPWRRIRQQVGNLATDVKIFLRHGSFHFLFYLQHEQKCPIPHLVFRWKVPRTVGTLSLFGNFTFQHHSVAAKLAFFCPKQALRDWGRKKKEDIWIWFAFDRNPTRRPSSSRQTFTWQFRKNHWPEIFYSIYRYLTHWNNSKITRTHTSHSPLCNHAPCYHPKRTITSATLFGKKIPLFRPNLTFPSDLLSKWSFLSFQRTRQEVVHRMAWFPVLLSDLLWFRF